MIMGNNLTSTYIHKQTINGSGGYSTMFVSLTANEDAAFFIYHIASYKIIDLRTLV